MASERREKLKEKMTNEYTFTYTKRQQIFLRFTFAILVDLTVLNLFDEFWDKVSIHPFSTSLFTAIVLQTLLIITMRIEHRVAGYFKNKPGMRPKIMRGLSAWVILFVSKLIILEIVNFFFGEKVKFSGAFHGVIAFIVVILVMVIAEKLVSKIFNSLASSSLK